MVPDNEAIGTTKTVLNGMYGRLHAKEMGYHAILTSEHREKAIYGENAWIYVKCRKDIFAFSHGDFPLPKGENAGLNKR